MTRCKSTFETHIDSSTLSKRPSRSRVLTGLTVAALLAAASAHVRALPQSPDEPASETAAQTPARDMTAYVSDRLTPVESEYMRHAIDQLPAAMKDRFLRAGPDHVSISVYDAASGTTHFNRPELEGHLSIEKADPLPGDDYPFPLPAEDDAAGNPSPQVLTSCGPNPAPGCQAGGGPYRRVFTPKLPAEKVCPSGVKRPCGIEYGDNAGYWNAGAVSVNCFAGAFRPGDVGYAFLGAYSATPTATGGTVDGGLQYLYEQDPKDPALDSYRLFLGILGVAKFVYASSASVPNHAPPLIACAHDTVSMELRITPWELNLDKVAGSGCVSSKGIFSPEQLPACGTVAFIIERGWGGIGGEYNSEAIVYVAPKIGYGGWGRLATANQGTFEKPQTEYFPQVPCGGCVFKWMTAISQEHENLDDTATFSATWSDRGIAPWAVHPGATVAPDNGFPEPMTEALTLCSEYPLWHGVYNGTTVHEDCNNSPQHGLTGDETVTRVILYSVSGESDSFVLH